MKSKHKWLVLGLSLSTLIASTTPVNADISEDHLNSLEEEQKKLQIQNDTTNKKTQYLEKEIQELEAGIETLSAELYVIEEKIFDTNKKIKSKELIIDELLSNIATIQENIKNKQNELAEKEQMLEEHLVSMYAGGGKVRLLEILFRSSDFHNFINRFEYYKEISKQADKLNAEIQSDIETIKEEEVKLENQKRQLEREKTNLEEQKEAQTTQQQKKEFLQEKLVEEKHHSEESLEEQKEAMKILSVEIERMEKEISVEKEKIELAKQAALKRQQELAQQQKETKNADVSNLQENELLLPLPKGSYYISSGFGYRTDPVYGTRGAFHSGTDFAAPYGTPIYAIDSGYVLFSGPASGYGHWIVIKHDNGLYSIYGHMYADQLYVKQGEYVFKGQHIGGVGSDGKSTGNHLHLCIATSYENGRFTYVNPLNYY